MSLAEVFNLISIIAFCIAIICFLISLFLWFKFKTPKIIGDLSGRTAKKSIEEIRKTNEKSGVKVFRPTPMAVDRGRLTDSIETAGNKAKTAVQQPRNNVQVNINSGTGSPTDVLPRSNANSAYVGGEATEVLKRDAGETQVLNYSSDSGTQLLDEGTQVLSPDDVQAAATASVTQNNDFNLIQNIELINTTEFI